MTNPRITDEHPETNRTSFPYRRTLIILAVIVTAAFALRLAYLFQIADIPFFEHLVSDAQSYYDWAGRIKDGDWWGDKTFYQAPAYPYFLAVARVITGDNLFGIRVLQSAMGAVACGLLGLAAWCFFSRRAALWSAVLLAVYPPSIFFSGLIQKTALAEFLGTATLALIGWEQLQRNRWKALAIGLTLGLFALTRENGLIWIPLVLAWSIVHSPHRSQRDGKRSFHHRCWRHPTAILAGTALILLPVALRNFAVGGDFALTTSQMGPNFYIGNNPDASGLYRPLIRGHETPEFESTDARNLAEEDLGRELSAGQVSRYWMSRSWHYIRSQPLHWLTLLGKKTLLVWNAYEIPDTESFDVYSEWSWLLGTVAPLLHFGVIAPLAAAGLALTIRNWRRLWLLYGLLMVTTAATAAFFVFARYRQPIVPICILFAAATIVETMRLFRSGQYRRLLRPLAAAATMAILCNLPIAPERSLAANSWGNLGAAFARQGHIARSIPFFERAVREEPNSADMHYNLGLAYAQIGQPHRAVEQFRYAQRLVPDLIEVDYQLADALEQIGDVPEAIHHYKRALAINPQDHDARAALQRLQPDSTSD